MRKFAADERAGQRRRSEHRARPPTTELFSAPLRTTEHEPFRKSSTMLATGLAALSFHNPRAEREFELEEEFELTGAAAQSAFLQTQPAAPTRPAWTAFASR